MQQATTAPPHRLVSAPTECAPSVWDRLWQNEPSDAKDDERLSRELRSPRWQLFERRILDTFRSMRGLRAVELGAGRGDLSVLLARAGVHVTLLDRSERALEQAQRRFDRLGLRGEFALADMLGPLDAWRGRFDLACSLGVIEHFRDSDRDRALDAHRRVLRPGGLVLLSVPHSFCLPYRLWKCYLELRGWWPYGMEIPYSKREILHRACHIGLVDLETKCTGLLQSIGGQLFGGFWKRRPNWVDRPSLLDNWMGLNLLLVGRRGE